MDFDKLAVIFSKIGFPVAVALWFMFKLQAYLDTMTVQQVQMVQLLQQLIELHRR